MQSLGGPFFFRFVNERGVGMVMAHSFYGIAG